MVDSVVKNRHGVAESAVHGIIMQSRNLFVPHGDETPFCFWAAEHGAQRSYGMFFVEAAYYGNELRGLISNRIHKRMSAVFFKDRLRYPAVCNDAVDFRQIGCFFMCFLIKLRVIRKQEHRIG